MKKIAFLDRDGTLIFEPPDTKQIDSLKKLQILPGAIDGLKNLQSSGYRLVMVSNQNGIGTDSFPTEAFEKPQQKLLELFRNEGIEFYKIFICPHFQQDNCDCRKPKKGLVENFFANESIDFEKSFMLGDRETDMEFAKNIGVSGLRMSTNGSFSRLAVCERKTTETDIFTFVNLDGIGSFQIDTGLNFFDHMLEQFSKHSLIDVILKARGDLQVDEHHTVEDTALVLGESLSKALGTRQGISRYGFTLPMDETLVEVAMDLSGRPYLVFNAQFQRDKVGDFPTELVEHFFQSLSVSLRANIHINIRYGKNTHHQIEALFKAFARTMRMACERDFRLGNSLPSTKGIL